MGNRSAQRDRRPGLFILFGAVLLAIAWFALTQLGNDAPLQKGVEVDRGADRAQIERPAESVPTLSESRSVVASEPEPPATPVSAPDVVAPEPSEPVAAEVAADPVQSEDPFPYGRPTPDWVFEQKYAGLSELEFATKKEEVSAAYALASKLAFQECWATGDFELVPVGQSPGSLPGDDRIMGGRVLAGATESQVVRLSVEKYPQVYQLFYEDLWFKVSGWKP